MRALCPYESNLGGILFSFYHFFLRGKARDATKDVVILTEAADGMEV